MHDARSEPVGDQEIERILGTSTEGRVDVDSENSRGLRPLKAVGKASFLRGLERRGAMQNCREERAWRESVGSKKESEESGGSCRICTLRRSSHVEIWYVQVLYVLAGCKFDRCIITCGVIHFFDYTF